MLALLSGLALLIWSADRFVDGAASVAKHYAVPPLLIGMIIIGFGTSAPEMMVSAFAAAGGKSGLALGNAYGSNIANIALILGATALICPIAVHSSVVKKEIPILLGVTALSAVLLMDGGLSLTDALILLGVFTGLLAWSFYEGFRDRDDLLAEDVKDRFAARHTRPGRAFLWVVVGLVILVLSSRLLVWGAVEIASGLGVPDLVIGLTIVAVGTSLPEFAASMSAALRGQADMAIGNVIGSNLFNTLAVVGIAGVINPMTVPSEVLYRDLFIVGLLTGVLLFVCFGFKRPGVINRVEGALLLICYAGYTTWLMYGVV